jgi:hypothetical protein
MASAVPRMQQMEDWALAPEGFSVVPNSRLLQSLWTGPKTQANPPPGLLICATGEFTPSAHLDNEVVSHRVYASEIGA